MALITMATLPASGALEVETDPDFPKSITKVAIAPLPDARNLDPDSIEAAITRYATEAFDSYDIQVVGAKEFGRLLETSSKREDVTLETIFALAAELGCDAVLCPRVTSSKGDGGTFTATTENYSYGTTTEIDVRNLEGDLLMAGRASFPTPPWQANHAWFTKVHFSVLSQFKSIIDESLE